MPFLTFEGSEQDAIPVEYYRFTCGPDEYLMTSADEPVQDPNTLEIFPCVDVNRGNPSQSKQEGQGTVAIKVPYDHELIQRLIRFIPPFNIDVTIYRLHLGDDDPRVIWKGRVRSIQWQLPYAVFQTESALVALSRNGLQKKYQNPCNHMLGVMVDGVGCPVDLDTNFKYPATVTNVVGTTVTLSGISALATDWLKAGYLQIDDGIGDKRSISGHTNPDTIVMSSPIDAAALTIGTNVFVFAGCDHLFSTCRGSKFGAFTESGAAYGGFPTIPLVNIFLTGIK